MRIIQRISTPTDEYLSGLEKTYLDHRHYREVLCGEDACVLDSNGKPALILLANALPADVCDIAPDLIAAAPLSMNRGKAAGGRVRRKKNDGSYSNTLHAKHPVHSGIVGMFDRTARWPKCRTTALTSRQLKRWPKYVRFARAASALFEQYAPERFAVQKAAADRTHPDWLIPGTPFSTMTINRNYRTSAHIDRGDLREGFGVISVVRQGNYSGGYLIFPRYEIAVDLHTTDLLLADVHELHGNSPIIGIPGKYERLSVVFYLRAKMHHCGSAEYELRQAQERKKGTPLYPELLRA